MFCASKWLTYTISPIIILYVVIYSQKDHMLFYQTYILSRYIEYSIYLAFYVIFMSVRRGGQGGSCPPPPGQPKIVCFRLFLGKNSIFFVAFQAKSRFLLPLGNFLPSPGKSLRTPMVML